MSTRGLASGKFAVMDLASDTTIAQLKEQIAAGSIPTTCREGVNNICETDANGFGELLQAYIDVAESAPRDELLKERDRRVCNVVNEVEPAVTANGRGIRIPNHPSFFMVLPGASTGTRTVPTGCNTEPPRPELAEKI
jgi:hypothetical protein